MLGGEGGKRKLHDGRDQKQLGDDDDEDDDDDGNNPLDANAFLKDVERGGAQGADVANNALFSATSVSDREFALHQKRQIDLEKLTFTKGAHFMSNQKCKLPPDSYKVTKGGYEEVYIPAPKKSALAQRTELVKISALPEWAQKAFPGVERLNAMQSTVYSAALNSSENMLVCAPTGAGKTNVALLTMLQVIGAHRSRDGRIETHKFKMVYIAPMKALVAELVGNFTSKLRPFGVNVRELTGDMQLSKQQIEETQLIIATPEKWDIITRKAGDRTYTELVRLVIIDEIHLLHDQRGPVIEALVARILRTVEQRAESVRIVGLSATLPNYVDVASFIRVKADSGLFHFDQAFRPVPLEQQYIGVTEKKPVRRMLLMNEILYDKVSERAGKHQMIVFVHSRRDTVKTAQTLRETFYAKDELSKLLPEESDSKKVLAAIVEREDIKSPALKELLEYGIAIHHAGLNRGDRDLVEDLFASKHI